MASMKRVRHIKEELEKARVDPRLTEVVCMLAERQRIQHQQMYEMASTIIKMQELMQDMIRRMGVRDQHLSMLGIEEMLKERLNKDVTVESVEEFDQDKESH